MNRRRISIGLAMLAICFWAVSSLADGFRGVAWGASKDDVRRTERHPLHHDIDDEIAYWNFQLGGIEAGLVYTFENGALIRAHYLSRSPGDDPERKLADFRTWKTLFDEHFGNPAEEEWIWADGGERGDDERTIEALTSGRAKAVARWEVGDSAVTLLTANDGGEIVTVRAIFEPR